jgi:hypothetical protein
MRIFFLIGIGIVSLFLLFSTCRKAQWNYRKTQVFGYVINLSTSTPMRNALIKLNEYPGEKAPPGFSGIVKSTTRTDERGYFRFDFDAYYPPGNSGIDNRAAYGVVYDLEGKFYSELTRLNRKRVDFEEYYNLVVTNFDHIDSIGEVNFSPIYVVMVRSLKIQTHNVYGTPNPNDSIVMDIKTLYLDEKNVFFWVYKDEQEHNRLASITDFVLPSGLNEIKFNIFKNGTHTVRDTSFFVDPEGIGDIVLHVNY